MARATVVNGLLVSVAQTTKQCGDLCASEHEHPHQGEDRRERQQKRPLTVGEVYPGGVPPEPRQEVSHHTRRATVHNRLTQSARPYGGLVRRCSG